MSLLAGSQIVGTSGEIEPSGPVERIEYGRRRPAESTCSGAWRRRSDQAKATRAPCHGSPPRRFTAQQFLPLDGITLRPLDAKNFGLSEGVEGARATETPEALGVLFDRGARPTTTSTNLFSNRAGRDSGLTGFGPAKISLVLIDTINLLLFFFKNTFYQSE